MVTLSQRRRHPRWRMFFAVVILSVLVRHGEPASTKRLTDSSSSSSSPTLSRSSSETRSQNLGSSSDLTWQAWLLLDSQTGAHSGMDSVSFLRRITPKSVFIAPANSALPPCAEGYHADIMGRCVKNVNIDHEAQRGFLLEKLIHRFEPSNSHKKSSGPLQLNIPLLSGTSSQLFKFDHQETRDSIKVPVVVPPRDEIRFNERKASSEVTTHRTRNISKEEDKSTIVPENSSASSAGKDEESLPSKVDTVVPVAEFVDDANESNFSDVVDYKIPIDLKALLNISSVRTVNINEDLDAWRNGSQLLNSTEASPMLILLSSTTISSTGASSTGIPSTVTSPTTTSTTATSTTAASTTATSTTAILPTTTAPTVTSSNSTVPDVEDLDNGTSHHADVWASNATRNVTDKEIISASVPESEFPSKVLDVPLIVVDKIESNKTQDGNSSEVQNTTVKESLEFESFYDDEEFEDYEDSTDLPDEESSEGEILKHGEAGMAIHLPIPGRIRTEQERIEPLEDRQPLEDPKSDELVAAPSSSESLLYDPGFRDRYVEEDPITEIYSVNEQSADSKETLFPKKSKDPSPFKAFEEPPNSRPSQENRHLIHPKQPIKFPSEEVNSIHNQNYKQRVPYLPDDGLHSSTKSSVFGRQKSFHRGPSLWRMPSRQQATSQQVESTTSGQRHRQPRISISFWTAMPLMRDPSLYSADQDSHSKTTSSQQYPNRFPEVSSS